MLTAFHAAFVLASAAPGIAADGAAVGPGPIVTYGNTAVVSRQSGEGYRLAEVVAGRLRDLNAAPRRVPFDVDIGPDRDGRVVAVYSRCAQEGRPGPGVTTIAYRTARRCRLYSVRVHGGRERRIALPQSRRSSTSRFLPTIWRQRLTWAETEDHRNEGYRIAAPRLMSRDGSGRIHRLRGGSAFYRKSDLGAEGPLALDQRGTRLAFAWSYVSSDTRCRQGDKADVFPASEAWALELGTARRLLVRAGCRTSGDRVAVAEARVTPTGWSTLELVGFPTPPRVRSVMATWTRRGHRTNATTLLPKFSDAVIAAATTTDGTMLLVEASEPNRLRVERPPRT